MIRMSASTRCGHSGHNPLRLVQQVKVARRRRRRSRPPASAVRRSCADHDLTSGRQISPVPSALAVQIAEADYVGDRRAARVSLVTEESPEYRAALPAWRVDFDDDANRALYVAQDTGVVTARRSTLWRVFDFLWGLHIMDFKNHEDFNTPLLIGATALALVMIVSGIILFPSRLGYNAWKRRRRKAVPRQPGTNI